MVIFAGSLRPDLKAAFGLELLSCAEEVLSPCLCGASRRDVDWMTVVGEERGHLGLKSRPGQRISGPDVRHKTRLPSQVNSLIVAVCTEAQNSRGDEHSRLLKCAEDFLQRARVICGLPTSRRFGRYNGSNLNQERELHTLLLSVTKRKLSKHQQADLVLRLSDMIAETSVNLSSRNVYTAISICVQAEAMSVAEQVVANVRSTGNISAINSHVYSQLIKGYCSSGQRKEAFTLLAAMNDQGINRDIVIYNILLESEPNPEGAALLWNEMLELGLQPNERTYSAAIRCYGRAGMVTEANSLWNKMMVEGIVPTAFTYNSLLDGEVKSSYKLLSELKFREGKVTVDSCNTILKAHARCRDADGAVKLLRSMQRRGIQPDIVSYNTVINTCVCGGKMQKAIRFAEEMKLQGLKKDKVTFATLLRAAGLLRDKNLVEKVLIDMKTVGCPHDGVTYRCAVYAYVHCGEGGAALEMLEAMSAAGFPAAMTVPEVLLKSVDAALLRECTAGAVAGRLQDLLEEMRSAGLSPTCETGGAMVRNLAHTDGIEVALDVAEELLEAGIGPLGMHTWQVVVGICSSNLDRNRYKVAEEVDRILRLMEIDRTNPDRVVLEAAIFSHTRCGNGERALRFHEQMEKLDGTKDSSKNLLDRIFLETMDAALLGAIAADVGGQLDGDAGSQQGKLAWPGTSIVMQELAEIGIRLKPRAVTNVIQQLCTDIPSFISDASKEGEISIRKPILGSSAPDKNQTSSKSVQRLQRAMGLVEASKHLFGIQITSFVYRALMEACIKLQLMEEVEQLWRKMRAESVVPDSATWSVRIKALLGSGNLRGRSHDLLAEAAGDKLELDIHLLRAMLKACYQCKDLAAVSHLRRMMDTSSRTHSSRQK